MFPGHGSHDLITNTRLGLRIRLRLRASTLTGLATKQLLFKADLGFASKAFLA